MAQKYHAVVARFAGDPRVRIHRGTSADVLPGFADGSLDWVYIDGNHNEPFIGDDIALCLRKVKPAGVIAGDDYNWMAEELGAPVKRAVGAALDALGAQARLKVMANQWRLQLARTG
jgi:predicted O-methyltransferase YrrM